MKKFIIALTALFALTVQANAMSYEQAREQALFLADKMAYELNLTEDQYEAAYEINLDYLMSINNYDDLYGIYWERRNMDLSYILLDWQYRAYCAASYFYRPLYWDAGYWHFGIYARYPHRSYFYFGRPHFYLTYRGGHAWHVNHGRSWYHGRNWGMAHRNHHGGRGFGMRNGFDRGDYRGRSVGHNGGRGFGNNRGRDIENRGNRGFENRGNRGFENRSNRGFENRGNRGIENRGTRSLEHRTNPGTINRNGNFGGQRGNNGVRQSSTRSTVGGGSPQRGMIGRERGSFSSERSTPSRTFTPSRSAGSDRGSSSFGSRSSSSRSNFSAPSRSAGSSSRGSFSAPSRSHGGSFSGSHSGGGSRGGGFHGGGSHGGSRGGHR